MFTKEERLFIWKNVYEESPETKEVRLNIVKDIIKELE